MNADLLHRLEAHADHVVHTHGSAVFLCGDDVYKVKKPVDFGFLDYSTLERRGHFCLEELRLNRRWSHGIYLGVVPVGHTFDDALEPVEWAVHMRRYDEAHTLQARWQQGGLGADTLDDVGRYVARVHARSPRSELAQHHGTFQAFHDAVLGVFDPPGTPAVDEEGHPRHVIPARLYDALRRDTLALLDAVRPAWTAREPLAPELHGDLRMEHVLVHDTGRIDVVDALEFSDALRCGDPVLDVAFLAMDLAVRGEPELAGAFVRGWVDASGDEALPELLPVAAAYRSCVRGKVAELLTHDPDVDETVRDHARERALRHWLWSASLLRPLAERPALLAVGGLPGSGKSTVARHLAEARGFTVVRADVIRKQRAGLPVDEPAPEAMKAELYAPATTLAVYRACLAEAERIVAAGGRAVVDATFADPVHRGQLLALGRRLGVPTDLWLCEVPEAVARARIGARPQGPSDADVDVLASAAARWTPEPSRSFDTARPLHDTLAAAASRVDHLLEAAHRALR